ncbi:MAG: hypothetical protein HY270_04440 [Deltaproteobacteria bacterium]|nr:hypothetical protein [Deltaproteobacteria bacterium]
MSDLGGFEVHRSKSATAEFERIGILPVADRDRFRQVKRFQYVDRAIELGVTYRYRVVSFTIDGYVSGPSNTVTVEHKTTGREPHASLPTPQR